MNLHLDILPGDLMVCRLAPDAPIPDWAAGTFTALTRTPDELSIVCAAAPLPDGVPVEGPFTALKVRGPLDFSMTGIVAELARTLADAAIPVFVISTFDTDYILVPRDRADATADALRAAGHAVTR